jgi:hypothetical protein
MPLPSSFLVAAPVARVGEHIVWECPHCHHQFLSGLTKPEAGSPLVAWLRGHVVCRQTPLPNAEDAAVERAAVIALVELDTWGH